MLSFINWSGVYTLKLAILGALKILNAFSKATGLRVNWHKSILFSSDPGAQKNALNYLPLQWVDIFHYVGVIVSRKVSDYVSLNLLPVLQEVKVRLKVWSNLPLSLLGYSNSNLNTAQVYILVP